MHCGYVVKVSDLRKHSNADRLQVATFFGNDTIVDLSVQVGDIGVYFPVDLQLSEEYCAVNNLVRKKDENGNNVGGFLDPEKRNIKAIKLRGEKSDGLFMPLASFAYCYDQAVASPDVAVVNLSVGDQVTVLNGHEICKKYIPKRQSRVGGYSNGNHTRKTKVPYAPLFAEHADTEQLAYNHGAFKAGDEIEITLKMHGTSQRTANLPVLQPVKKTFWQKLFKKEPNPVYAYDYVSGTRRVVMEDFEGGNSFYGSNEFREQHSKVFEGKLWKGETAYYEVVGFTHTGAPIMASCDNKKLNDKEFVKQYGKTTTFSYGCSPDEECVQSDIYVYRMTMTNEDGEVVEYTPDQMRHRCMYMGVKTVPLHWYGFIPDEEVFTGTSCEYTDPGQFVLAKAEEFYDGEEPIDPTHIREGVVVRVINRPTFTAYKHKNHTFKVISGIIAESVADGNIEISDEDVLAEL